MFYTATIRYLKFTKAQNERAVRVHRKCWRKDQQKMKAKKHVDRIENGVYRTAGM